MIFNVLSLSFINVEPPHDFIMLFAGHHVFSSIQAILSQYKFCIFNAVSSNLSSFQPNICSIIGNSYGEFIIDFTTFSGHATNQSEVINSDRNRNSLFGLLLYLLNIFFVIILHGKSVTQSIGANQSIMCSVYILNIF